ncbi:hypothetical protein J8V57_02755 [Xenorhabdus sp. PB61.4]|uniref:hypothetical protein n=1 Tax=Xenorhabdus TaxID=626 RepID=UPI001E610054|nr:hypothetical protein [Xenorhabdus sp. PB61.4]MCC8365205.1 hypothetical protein [Xenorhabdus sp. PB61.4]
MTALPPTRVRLPTSQAAVTDTSDTTSMGKNDKLHRFISNQYFWVIPFDSADDSADFVTAILAQSFHHRHFITVTP